MSTDEQQPGQNPEERKNEEQGNTDGQSGAEGTNDAGSGIPEVDPSSIPAVEPVEVPQPAPTPTPEPAATPPAPDPQPIQPEQTQAPQQPQQPQQEPPQPQQQAQQAYQQQQQQYQAPPQGPPPGQQPPQGGQAQQSYQQQYGGGGAYQPPMGGQLPQAPNATAILVLGILSIVFCWCYGVVGAILATIALAMCGSAMRAVEANPAGFQAQSVSNLKTGKILAIIGLVLSALFLLWFIFAIATAGLHGSRIYGW